MRPVGRKYCPLTHATTFLEAMSHLLVTTGRALLVTEIEVSRTADRAIIRYLDIDADHAQREVEFSGIQKTEPGISVLAKLSAALLREIYNVCSPSYWTNWMVNHERRSHPPRQKIVAP